MEPRKLSHPPITEALVDLRVELPEDVQLSTLASFQDEIRKKYPHREERFMWSGEITLLPGVAVSGSIPQVNGYLFRSADARYVVQARLDGFTFSILPPYEGWSHVHDEVLSLWEHYISIAKPTKVTRIALRYIDQISLPADIDRIQDYLLTYPLVSSVLPREMSDFFMRMILHENGLQAILSIATQNRDPNTRTLLIDVDAFKLSDFNMNHDEIWNCIESLRALKNKIFFGCLTDLALEKYK